MCVSCVVRSAEQTRRRGVRRRQGWLYRAQQYASNIMLIQEHKLTHHRLPPPLQTLDDRNTQNRCVKLSHHQRLQARTGVTRYDLEAEDAVWWVKTAWVVGTLGATLLFAAASVPGDEKGSSTSAQSVLHLVLSLLAACGLIGQTACTAWALRKAR